MIGRRRRVCLVLGFLCLWGCPLARCYRAWPLRQRRLFRDSGPELEI